MFTYETKEPCLKVALQNKTQHDRWFFITLRNKVVKKKSSGQVSIFIDVIWKAKRNLAEFKEVSRADLEGWYGVASATLK